MSTHTTSQPKVRQSISNNNFNNIDNIVCCLFSVYFQKDVSRKRARSPPDLCHPDGITFSHLNTTIPHLTESSNEYVRWFQNQVDSSAVSSVLRFPIASDSLNVPNWTNFRSKYCYEVHDDSQACTTLVSVLENFALYPIQSTTDDAEMTGNGILDSLLNVLCLTLLKNRSRNAAIATSAGDRPDYALHIVFIGEDKLKRNYVKGKVGHDPRVDLLYVTPFEDWVEVFGPNVPFIIGYTSINSSSGADFQLGLIDRVTETFIPLHEPLNLTQPFQRALAAEYVLLVRPALLALHRSTEQNSIRGQLSYSRKRLHPRVDISVHERVRNRQRIAEKVWKYQDEAAALELCIRMRSVFDALGASLPFKMILPLIKVSANDNLTVKAFFTPVGAPCTVTSLPEIRYFALDLLDTLDTMKEKNIVHHDIRMSNIVSVRGEKRDHYVLIDFDEAQQLNAQGTCPPVPGGVLDSRTHCPLSFTVHGCEVDLWSVGQVLREITDNPLVVALGADIQKQCTELSLAEARKIVNTCFDSLLPHND